MADLAIVGRRPHMLGSVEDARVRAYLLARMRDLGLETGVQAFAPSPAAGRILGDWAGGSAGDVRGVNVVGRLRGRDRGLPALLLIAHHDTVSGSPGANDDGFGVVTLLDAARAIRAAGVPRRDVVLLFTDGEEIGLEGAKAFFAAHPWRGPIGIAINLDARGAGGRVALFQTSPGNGALIRLVADVVPDPWASSIAGPVYRRMPNSTDLTVALAHGVPGYGFAPLGRANLYHSRFATPAAIDRATLDDMGHQVVALASALAFADRLPPREPDVAFGDLLGSGLLIYPVWAGWLVVAAAGGLLAFAIVRTRPGWVGLGHGATAALWLGSHGALLLILLNLVSGASGDDRNYYDRLAALPRLEAIAVLAGLAAIGAGILISRPPWPTPRWAGLLPALVLSALGLLLGGDPPVVAMFAVAAFASGWVVAQTGLWQGWLGAIGLVMLGAAALQAFEPGAAPMLAWPLLPACAAAAVAAWIDPSLDRGAGVAAAIGAVAIGGGQTLALAHFLFLSIGAARPQVVAPAELRRCSCSRCCCVRWSCCRGGCCWSAASGLVWRRRELRSRCSSIRSRRPSRITAGRIRRRLWRDDLCRAIR
jgi:hypothetical protein